MGRFRIRLYNNALDLAHLGTIAARQVSRSRTSGGRAEVTACFALALLLLLPCAGLAQDNDSLAQQAQVLRGGMVSAPVTPEIFTDDVRALPRQRAWRAGEPIREVPKRRTQQSPHTSATSILPPPRELDSLGTMPQGETTLIDGSGVQRGFTRWGDYSSLNVNPQNDCTFWYTSAYVPDNGDWQTRIGRFVFDECFTTRFVLTGRNIRREVCAPGEIRPILVEVGQVHRYQAPVTLSYLDLPAGMIAAEAVCRNHTTGEALRIDLAGATSWSCTAAGLVATPDDMVTTIVTGIAE